MKGLRYSILTAGVLLTLSVALVSCSTQERAPDGVLDKTEMVKVLTEIYVAEEKVNRLGLKNDSATVVFEKLREKVFTKMDTPDSIFKESLRYYMEHPKEMELIYTALVDSLNLNEQRESVREKPKSE